MAKLKEQYLSKLLESSEDAGTFSLNRTLGNADSLPVYSLVADLAKGKKNNKLGQMCPV